MNWEWVDFTAGFVAGVGVAAFLADRAMKAIRKEVDALKARSDDGM